MARHIPTKNTNPEEQKLAEDGEPDPNADPNPGMVTHVERAGEGPLQQVRASVRGGSIGVIPEAERRVFTHGTVTGSAKVPERAGPVPKAKRFTLVGPINAHGKISFMYEGQRVAVNVGKEVSDATYDLDMLRRQGIKMTPIVEEEPIVVDEPELEEAASA